jgi:hypothetical protein
MVVIDEDLIKKAKIAAIEDDTKLPADTSRISMNAIIG